MVAMSTNIPGDEMDTIARFIWQINKNNQLYMADRLEKYKIGSGQYPLLMLLFSTEKLSQEELSRFLNIDKGATAKTVARLMEGGYITRRTDPKDKRRYQICLTEKANRIRSDLESAIEEWHLILLEGLSGEERRIARHLLEVMKENSKLAHKNGKSK
jgi:DNA-binding MarR family transcriptional regulator